MVSHDDLSKTTQDSYQCTTARVLTNRQKKNKKEQDAYNSSFVSNEDANDNDVNAGTLASYMLKDSLIENEREGYLPTEREGEDVDDYGRGYGDSGSKFDDSIYDGENSIMVMDETMTEDLESSRNSSSPRGRQPKTT